MVSAFLLPEPMAKEMNENADYSLYLMTPPVGIATVLAVGHIWYQRGLQRWNTSLGSASGYFLVKENGVGVATMYVDKRVALKLTWFDDEENRTETVSYNNS